MLPLPGQTQSLDELQAIHAGGRPAAARPGRAAGIAGQRGRGAGARPPATRRSTASTPASASWPARASGSEDLATLQWNLIRSHSVGVGEPLPPPWCG
jgi:histidine ammonia-lyase